MAAPGCIGKVSVRWMVKTAWLRLLSAFMPVVGQHAIALGINGGYGTPPELASAEADRWVVAELRHACNLDICITRSSKATKSPVAACLRSLTASSYSRVASSTLLHCRFISPGTYATYDGEKGAAAIKAQRRRLFAFICVCTSLSMQPCVHHTAAALRRNAPQPDAPHLSRRQEHVALLSHLALHLYGELLASGCTTQHRSSHQIKNFVVIDLRWV